ncbi:MAG: ATP-dependent nuclease [Sphingomicrobium sp.]
MIKSIALKNFRGFREHTVDFTPFCLLIGQNNAGKTTLVEALRIASAALKKAASAQFAMAPDAIGPEITGSVYRFSLDTLDIEDRGIHYNYRSNDPAIIRVRYSNNCQIVVALGETLEDTYCQLLLPGGKKVNSRTQANPSKFRSIFVMPPVGALLAEETERDKRYLYKHINGYLSYRHIRNQMADMPAEFVRFKEMLTETWSTNLQVGDIEYGLGEKQNHYGLTIRDGPFVSEMALVGSGLQAWIQTTWFLARVDPDSIVILDEPDVFLHADLQKKLIKLLAAERYRQTIVATHSLEMIADVAPAEIVSVSKRAPRSRALSSSAQAQSVVETIGTNLNMQLSKVAAAGKILFVEGKDYGFIDQIAFKEGNVFYDRFSKVPHFSVGGMNNWPRAAMASRAFYETSSGKVEGVMFIDRDYKPDELFEEIVEEARKDNLRMKVWSRKELENYLVDAKLIHSHLSRDGAQIDFDVVHAIVEAVIAELADDLPVLIADGYQTANRKLSLPTAMKMAKAVIKERRDSGVPWRDIVGGKRALSMISERCRAEWGAQVSPMSLCRHMRLDDVPSELRLAVESLV